MDSLNTILRDLKELQTQLKFRGNSLWQLKSALQRACQQGHKENDFLPRRLTSLQNEAQFHFEGLLSNLRQMALKSLNPKIFVFNSPEEVKTFLKIKQTIRSLQNAYMDHSLRETLSHWNSL